MRTVPKPGTIMRRTDEASGPSLAISLAVYRLFVISLVSAAASQS
jgi:hypothetical protein